MELKLRQTVPLAVLRAMGGSVKGRTRMTKLVFLVEDKLVNTEIDLNDSVDLEFYPYDYGPFSKVLLNDLEELKDGGVIEITRSRTFRSRRYDYKFTPSGESAFEDLANSNEDVEKISSVAEDVVESFGEFRIRELLDYIYEEFPEYQENSVYY